MPASRKTFTGAATRPSVLLLEEYDALSVAFASALKKFAPSHDSHVARSTAEAAGVAKTIRPELIVIDFDPPQSGIVQFLNEMKKSHGDARVLVIAAGTSREITAVRGVPGAIQFIEKPFELADFGAAVQALLGPWTTPGHQLSRGCLRNLDLVDVISLLCLSAANSDVKVEAADELEGEVHIRDGHIVHAITGARSGADGLREMLLWREVSLSERRARLKAPRTIQGPWHKILVEALRQTSVARQEQKSAAAPQTTLRTGKKIMVIDDTEMLLIFAQDVLAAADSDWQIFTATSGAEGAKRTEALLPDLVLIDFNLPDLRGDEVCRALLENEKTAVIPVIMMSGHVDEMRAAAARLRNVVATIEKPFFSDRLLTLIRQTLASGVLPAPEKSKEPITAPQPPLPPPPVAPPPPIPSPVLPAFSPPPPPPLAVAAPAGFPLRESFSQPLEISRPVVEAKPSAQLPRAQIATSTDNDVVLGLVLEVISMQLTPQLQMDAIRARPTSPAVSLQVKSPSMRHAWPMEIGFELGPIELTSRGKIDSLRLVPTRRPVEPVTTRNALEIDGVSIVPVNAHECVQLTSAPNAPMTMQFVAQFEVAAVELSTTFEVSALLLKPRSQNAQIRFASSAGLQTSGAEFETAVVQLDDRARIAEMVLNRAG